MIEVRNVVKTFDGFNALDGLNMTVNDGCVYGLVGPNGAGKSTIIRHILGIYKQDGGDVLVDGKPVWENVDIKGELIGIPDEWYHFPQANIRDMMNYLKGIYPNFSMERYEKCKEIFALDEKMPLRRMSKGMKKQASFWLALCCMPKYLILDEPVDGLDPVMRRQVWSLIVADVAERGTTVLVSSHNLRELEDVCDYVGIMNNGKIMLEVPLSQLQDNTVKVQYATAEDSLLPEELDVLSESAVGKVRTLIIRGKQENVLETLRATNPIILESIPLTLEEIFIYELGGENYEVKDIVL